MASYGRNFIMAALLIVMPTIVAAQDWHVNLTDPNADFHTIQACADAAKAGDTCLVSPGQYPEHISTKSGGTDDSHRITFKAQGMVTMKGFSVGNPYITVDGFDITGYAVSYFGSITILKGGSYCQILNNTIRDGATPASTYGMLFYNSGGLAATNCVVRGNRLTNINFHFLGTNGSGHLFENNTFENIHGWDVVRLMGHDIVFRRNLFRTSGAMTAGANHPDFVQTFGDNNPSAEAYNILFEENWIGDLDSQISQMTADGAINIRDWIFT